MKPDIEGKRAYLAIVAPDYRTATKRAEKSQLLDQITRQLEISRKAAIRLLTHEDPGNLQRGGKRKGRPKYSEGAKAWLVKLWHKMGRMNSAKMREALPVWLPHFIEQEIPLCHKAELLLMSARSIERFLAEEKRAWRRKENSGTKPSKHIANVPVKNLEEQPTEVGHIEIDSVAHCGGSLSGTHAWTVTATDIVTGWTCTRTIMGKDGARVRDALFELEQEFPFKWKAIHFDNGTEFLNDDVIYGFARKGDGEAEIPVFRGRPYRKNDQAHVEQKNWTHVRELWGYERVASSVAVGMMNAATRRSWHDLQNFFVPQQKVILNERHGAKRKRKVDKPRTPFERLLDHTSVPLHVRSSLVDRYQALSPFVLREHLKKDVQRVFQYIDRAGQGPRRYAS